MVWKPCDVGVHTSEKKAISAGSVLEDDYCDSAANRKGVLSIMILAFIETGAFGGTSFYGAVLMVPLLIMPAMLMKITHKDILNLCAPAECAMLLVMRFDCLDKDCAMVVRIRGSWVWGNNHEFSWIIYSKQIS